MSVCPSIHKFIKQKSSFSEQQRMTPWSPWVKTNTTEDGYFEQRYRFMCRANVPDDKMIKSSHVKSHVRYCFKQDNECHRPGELSNQIDTFSPLDHALRKYCKHRRKLFKRYCRCRTLGIFLVCSKCNHRWKRRWKW